MNRYAESEYDENGRKFDADICFTYFHPCGEVIDTDSIDIRFVYLTPKDANITTRHTWSYFSDWVLDIWRDEIGACLQRHYPDMAWCTPASLINQAW